MLEGIFNNGKKSEEDIHHEEKRFNVGDIPKPEVLKIEE